MITLFQFQPCLGVRNPSPFCLKLETYLKMIEQPYEVADNANLLKAPKKKFPYIQDDTPEGSITVADSSFIIDYLKKTYGDPLDQHLSLPEQGTLLAFRRLMEENLYWVLLYSRWFEDENWVVIRKVYFADLPIILRNIVPGMVRRDYVKAMDGHGIGRHSRDEIYDIGERDVKALSDFLGGKPFFMGEAPTSLDATAYGFLANLIKMELPSVISDYARRFDNLKEYCDRMESKYWQ
ncbi:MAG: glutathione S-transferase family protein [Cyanobacteria bacterium P01_F01_bin.3]